MLTSDLSGTWRSYFELREIPWEGGKAAIRYQAVHFALQAEARGAAVPVELDVDGGPDAKRRITAGMVFGRCSRMGKSIEQAFSASIMQFRGGA